MSSNAFECTGDWPGLESMSPPALVVFDLLGTTVQDSDSVYRFMVAACLRAGIQITMEEAISHGGEKPFDALAWILSKHIPGKDLIDATQRIHLDFRRRINDHYRTTHELREFPGASYVFAELQMEGIRIGLKTGFDRTTTSIIMERLQWKESSQIDLLITGEESSGGTGLVQCAIRKSGIENFENVAVVSGTFDDIAEGRFCGCKWTIATPTGPHSRQELESWNPTHVITSLGELSEIFLGRVLN